MIETILLQTPYYLLSLGFLLTSGVCVISVRKDIGSPLWLVLTIPLVSLSMFFFLIGATSTTTGHLSRGQIEPIIRNLAWIGGVVWLIWLSLFVRKNVTVHRTRSGPPSS